MGNGRIHSPCRFYLNWEPSRHGKGKEKGRANDSASGQHEDWGGPSKNRSKKEERRIGKISATTLKRNQLGLNGVHGKRPEVNLLIAGELPHERRVRTREVVYDYVTEVRT